MLEGSAFRFTGLCAVAGSLVLGACRSEPSTDGAPVSATPAAEEGVAAPRPRGRQRAVQSNGLLPGMARFRGGGPNQDSNPVCSNPKLSYFGGPILQQPVVVAVFWSSAVNATLQANIGQFYADITQSSYWSWLHEYDTVGLSGGSDQAILPGTSGGSFVITPLKCAPGGTNCKLTDQDVQDEITRQIGLGVLPAPTLDCTGNVETVYMVHYPPNVSLGGPQGAGKSCVNNGFCGYHNTGTFGPSGTPLVYASIMDTFTGPCALGCGSNATSLEDATSLASHELAEAATAADVGLDVQVSYAAPAAWGDNDNDCGEIADICDDGSPGDTIVVSGRSWVVQQLWSNAQGKCTSSGPVAAVCSGTTVSGCRKCSCGDNGNACNGGTSVCESSASNVLFGACEQCTAASATCTSGTCQQSSTPAQDDVCSGCTPLTSCPAGDDCGTVSDGCGGVVNCGACTAPAVCGGGTPSKPNQCGTPSCLPFTCATQGATCGLIGDGCGGTLMCGTCAAPKTCGGGGTPNQCGCTAATQCPSGVTCGTSSDGCGGTILCGTCAAPLTCGGGGKLGVCGMGCVPLTCPELGANCGALSDGCGGIVQCGSCPAPEQCGGGGMPNVCGPGICDPLTCANQNIDCGPAKDGCGGMLNCGNCAAPTTCGGGGAPGQCGCTGTTCAASGASCGTISDGCGTLIDCGGCMPPDVCGVIAPNQCGCLPADACPGDACGDLDDGCGGVLPCGACSAGQVCSNNQCVPQTSSSSSSSTGTTSTTTSTTTATSTTATSTAAVSSSSGGSGQGGSSTAEFPIYGRAGCSVATPAPDAPDASNGGSSFGVVTLAALAWLGRRRPSHRRGACPRAT